MMDKIQFALILIMLVKNAFEVLKNSKFLNDDKIICLGTI